jgi:SAM-dependent methyltransferase
MQDQPTGPRVLDPEDIEAVYRALLGRGVEPRALEAHLGGRHTLAGFLKVVTASPEFGWAANRWALQTLRVPTTYGAVQARGTPEQIERLIAHARAVWSSYGEQDPYWSVITAENFRAVAIDTDAIETFYASGANDLIWVLDSCARNGVELDFSGVALDFGCGVARAGQHLAARFAHYIGVDISQPHLKLAAERCASVGLANTTFQTLPQMLDQPPSVDFIYSVLVLQHNAPPVMADLLGRLCAALRPGGLIYFQVPVALRNYTFDLEKYLAAPPAHGQMEMHCLPQRDVFQILADHQVDLLEMLPDYGIGSCGLSATFFGRKRQA